MEKSKYYKTPLTEAEKEFMEDEKNIKEFYHFMRIKRLDPNEWFDILVLSYLKAVRKYLNDEKLKNYKFEQVLYMTLGNGYMNHFRENTRMKRMPDGAVFSLDECIESEANRNVTIAHYIADTMNTAEENIIENDRVNEIICCLNDTEKYIVSMLCEGYSHKEIAERMNISYTKIFRMIQHIRQSVAAKLSEL